MALPQLLMVAVSCHTVVSDGGGGARHLQYYERRASDRMDLFSLKARGVFDTLGFGVVLGTFLCGEKWERLIPLFLVGVRYSVG